MKFQEALELCKKIKDLGIKPKEHEYYDDHSQWQDSEYDYLYEGYVVTLYQHGESLHAVFAISKDKKQVFYRGDLDEDQEDELKELVKALDFTEFKVY